ncbi:class I SAM-dependent methyltransferase [Aneurinibacillus sp. REN35]|uniref:class I SAM-dependent methyltransferase n=1 Tax=Aneurinibacillus sp. REN35 TaxID=3237286 RepID=UPI0035298BC0
MENNRNDVMEKFNGIAHAYNNQRRKLIPCFDDFYTIPVSIAESKNDSPNILDIGAGTGLLSAFMLEKYPKANLTLIDLSEKMLEIAKLRFEDHPNVKYIVDDYTTYAFEDTFDIVMSSLSIHHITDEEKQNVYHKSFSIIKNDGVFINADQVLGSTPYIESLYTNDWKKKIETSGLTKQEILSAYERTALDKMSTLEDQVRWLKEAGFSDVDCIYKYFNFVVLFGRKIK